MEWDVLTCLLCLASLVISTSSSTSPQPPMVVSSTPLPQPSSPSPPSNINSSSPRSAPPSSVPCPDNLDCDTLPLECLTCQLNASCQYGSEQVAECLPTNSVPCKGNKTTKRRYECRYCYQTDLSRHVCTPNTQCRAVPTEGRREYYSANCTVPADVLCLGMRGFPRRLPCNWTRGYRWSTALVLSVTLGGFGADRFYLGQWREGIGKLFSLGGLGVWTLVDVVLVALGYVGPEDGSLYIY